MGIKILVCGDRNWTNRQRLSSVLDKICLDNGWVTNRPEDREDGNWLPTAEIISGMAKGADTIAVDWAVVNWVNFHPYPADWNRFGRAAGPIRNEKMLNQGKPDMVVGFHNDLMNSKGTRHMIKIAFGVAPVVRVYREDSEYTLSEILQCIKGTR